MNSLHVIRKLPLLLGLLIIGSATLAEAHSVGSPTEKLLDSRDAKRIARSYLDSIGFSRAGTSVHASAFIGKTELVGETWVVRVLTGKRLPSEKAVVLIDARTGDIQKSLKVANAQAK